MSGTATALGVVSVAVALPGMAELDELARSAQAAASVEITGKLTGLASVSAALAVPPLPGVTAEAAAKLAVQLALNPSVAAPSLQVAANAKIAGELNAQLGTLVMPDLGLGAAGVGAYKYEGSMDSLGSGLGGLTQGGLPGGSGSDLAYAVLLVATTPAAIAALKNVLIG
jgi:hypothetical protein